jgi:hypothetical protein
MGEKILDGRFELAVDYVFFGHQPAAVRVAFQGARAAA